MDVGSGIAASLVALQLVLILVLIVLFVRMAFDVRAIRTMLENQGLFSGVACRHCRMPVPQWAEVCGHCGRQLHPGSRVSAEDSGP